MSEVEKSSVAVALPTNSAAKPIGSIAAPSRFAPYMSLLKTSGFLPLVLIAMFVLFSLASPEFLTAQNITNIARQSVYLLIITIGQMITLLCGQLDLSVGATVGLTSVIAASVLAAGDGSLGSLLLGVVAGLLVGIVIGVVNGLVVTTFKVPAFMVTLGTGSIGVGVALMISRGVPVSGVPVSASEFLGTGRIMGVPTPVIIAVVLTIVAYVLLTRTPMGRSFYIIGANAEAARIAGIRVKVVLVVAFVLCGALTSLAAVLLTARVASGEATLGSSYVLLSIAAAVLGGTSLFGGEGHLGLVILGVLFIGVLSNGMNLVSVSSYLQEIVLGVVLIAAIAIDRWRA
jgi:ribose/xylose/arabinose/galactoside ABC-type transport system permease subunit